MDWGWAIGFITLSVVAWSIFSLLPGILDRLDPPP